jgi:hypothetical protein
MSRRAQGERNYIAHEAQGYVGARPRDQAKVAKAENDTHDPGGSHRSRHKCAAIPKKLQARERTQAHKLKQVSNHNRKQRSYSASHGSQEPASRIGRDEHHGGSDANRVPM